jgi:lambda family phage minor tail protein L
MAELITTDLQLATPSGSGKDGALLTFFEVEIPNSDAGGVGEDRLFFHPGTNDSNNDITWYTLKAGATYGSTSSSDYKQVTYIALPIMAEGFETRADGTLPRPTVKLANINAYFNTYLTNYDDLVGAKVIRRRTLNKYITNNPPIELNRDVYYVERKTNENSLFVEFELASAFDIQGIQVPRRTIIAARCPWKYQDTTQGGCDWPVDNKITISGVEYTVYFTKEDENISVASNLNSPSSSEYTYWGRLDVQSNRTTSLYAGKSYAKNDYVEYYRPVGEEYTITATANGSNTTTYTFASHPFAVGDYIIVTGNDNYNYKNVPLYVSAVTATTVTVQDDNSASGSNTNEGHAKLARNTLYKCKVAHTIATSDSADALIKPTNITYWERGDICGKRLQSCADRFGFNPAQGKVISAAPVIQISTGNIRIGSGYTSAPTVTVSGGGGSGAAITANLGTGANSDKVVSYTVTNGGSGYTSEPTLTVSGGGGTGAYARANVSLLARNKKNLPFGGFPGAALY